MKDLLKTKILVQSQKCLWIIKDKNFAMSKILKFSFIWEVNFNNNRLHSVFLIYERDNFHLHYNLESKLAPDISLGVAPTTHGTKCHSSEKDVIDATLSPVYRHPYKILCLYRRLAWVCECLSLISRTSEYHYSREQLFNPMIFLVILISDLSFLIVNNIFHLLLFHWK